METSNNAQLASQKSTANQVNQQIPSAPGDWQCRPPLMSILAASSSVAAPQCSSVPVTDSITPGIWTNSAGSPNFGLAGSGIPGTTSPPNCVPGGNPAAVTSRGLFFAPIPGIMPAGLPHFPTDSNLIERAARFSCFSGMVGSYGPSAPMASYDQLQKTDSNCAEGKDHFQPVDHGSDSLNDVRSPHIDALGNGPHDANLTESSRANAVNQVGELSPQKRKRINQDTDTDQVQRGLKQFSETAKDKAESKQQNEQQFGSKSSGKQVKEASDGEKEPYIHVRARRGQATNSHSLAERVRREKISERMRYLQDLVPGCSKVTGKAVMLDEIINYVQSLQRQVEFLSMKLAAVNPRLDFNIEGLLAGDLLHSRAGPSSAVCFSQDIIHPQLQLSQHGLAQPGISSMANHSETLRRIMTSQLSTMSSYKEPMLQMHGPWDEELHNVMQTAYGGIATVNSNESNSKFQDKLPAYNHQSS